MNWQAHACLVPRPLTLRTRTSSMKLAPGLVVAAAVLALFSAVIVPASADAAPRAWKQCATWTDYDAWMKYTTYKPTRRPAPLCSEIRPVARYFATHPADRPYRGWRMRWQGNIPGG